jgi:hypothetical protein
MPVASDVFTVLHSVLLLGFISVTSLLLLMTIANRLRVDRVVVSWWSGRLCGLPLWPSVFIVTALFFFALSFITGRPIEPVVFGGYLTGGVFWFTSSLVSTATLVTKQGVVCNVNMAGQAVAWGQVVDYFERPHGKHARFVFFYLDGHGTRRRLEITVPAAHREVFVQVIRAKLDARFEFSMQQAYGKKALEG